MQWRRYQANIEDTKFDIKGYDVKKDYMYRIVAVNEFGKSDPSNSLSVYAKTRKFAFRQGVLISVGKKKIVPEPLRQIR